MTNFLSSIKPSKAHFLFLTGADLCVGTEGGIDQRRECWLKSMGTHEWAHVCFHGCCVFTRCHQLQEVNNDMWPVVNVVYVGVNYDRLLCHWLPRLIGLTALTAHSFQLSNGAFVWMAINLTFHIICLIPPLMWRQLQFLFFFWVGGISPLLSAVTLRDAVSIWPPSPVSIWPCPLHPPLTSASILSSLATPINLLSGVFPGLSGRFIWSEIHAKLNK